jgi:hypothetical protein
MDAPAYLSGLSDQEHGEIVNHHVATKFGVELARLEELDEAIAGVEAAVEVAQGEVRRSMSRELLTVVETMT